MDNCSLENSIRTASLLAQSDNVIRKLTRNQPLSDNEKHWALNMFNIHDFNDEYSGKIAYIMLTLNKHDQQKILDLSKKISNKNTLSKDEWKYILSGVEEYRSQLIIKSRQCACGCD